MSNPWTKGDRVTHWYDGAGTVESASERLPGAMTDTRVRRDSDSVVCCYSSRDLRPEGYESEPECSVYLCDECTVAVVNADTTWLDYYANAELTARVEAWLESAGLLEFVGHVADGEADECACCGRAYDGERDMAEFLCPVP
jgi:hypothetical protein